MSELQNDSVESETIEPEAIENQEIETDLAPVSEAEHEEQPQVDEEAVKQEAIQKAINKKHFEAKQAERERDEFKARLDEIERKEREAQAAQINNLPEWPDEFDDNFEQKKANYIEAVRKQEAFNAKQDIYLQQQQLQQQQAAQAQQQAQAKLEQDFLANARKGGAKDDEIIGVVNTLVQAGLSGDLGSAIMADPEGYYIAKHLAANPMEAHELNSMNPILAGAKYAELKGKASALKPKTSNAPEPATNLSGNGVDPDFGKHPYISGATFE